MGDDILILTHTPVIWVSLQTGTEKLQGQIHVVAFLISTRLLKHLSELTHGTAKNAPVTVARSRQALEIHIGEHFHEQNAQWPRENKTIFIEKALKLTCDDFKLWYAESKTHQTSDGLLSGALSTSIRECCRRASLSLNTSGAQSE